MSLKFYLDDDSADAGLVKALQARGFEVLTPQLAGLPGVDDIEHLNFCAKRGFVLVTHNIGDFRRLHAEFVTEGKSHSGIILTRQQTLGIGERVRRLVRISNARTAEEMKDRIEYLSNW